MLRHSFISIACIAYVAAAADVCGSLPYAQLSCLTLDQDISLHCSSSAGTYQTTATSTVVHTTVVTPSTPVATMTSTGVTIITETIKPAAETTAYEATLITSAIEATVTQYTTADASKSTSESGSYTTEASAYRCKRAAREPALLNRREDCDDQSASAIFSSLGADDLATACSCLGAAVVTSAFSSGETVTRTKTITLASVVATTLETGIIHLTAEAATTVTTAVVTSITTTHTVYAAAPTYTRVWGPRQGCQDTAQSGTLQLALSVTQQAAAVSQCQAGCTNTTWCESVYVQQMFTDYGDVETRWQCYYNKAGFEASDVQCGRETGTYGTAVAFNAVGRG